MTWWVLFGLWVLAVGCILVWMKAASRGPKW